jgi:glycosyltransferase involved in cell wall biosynthesis
MKILVVSQFYHPEMGAPAARFGDFGHYFLAAGHDVTVLTTFPNFPQGRIQTGVRQRASQQEFLDGIRVIRTPVLALGGHTPLRKAMLYATFAGSALLQGALRDLRPDVVIGTTPPPTVGYTSYLLAKRFNAPHVLDVRDIWPEAVVAAGRVQAGPAVHALEAMNRVVLEGSAAVTTVSQGKRVRLLELGAREGTVEVIPNGVDLARFDREADANADEAREWLQAAGVPRGRQTVVYAGVFNPPQGLDLVLDLARERQARGDDPVHFALVGDGSLRTHLLERVAAEGLLNVTVAGPIDRRLVPGLYRCAWATLVILRPRRDEHTVPSKIYESMASGRPVLLSADGEVTGIARTAECGPVSGAGDGPGLQAGIDALLADETAAARHGRLARSYVEAHNDRARLAGRYLDVLKRVTGRAS